MAGIFTDGEVAIVTGAAGGIGRASAELFAREGARVVVADVQEPALQETVDRIAGAGGEATAVPADVTDEAQVQALVEAALDRYGRLDCAHNNAGISDAVTAFADLTLEQVQRMLGVNLVGVFLCMKHELKHMVDTGRGAVVNTASGAGVVGAPGLAHYSASKHGVLGLTKSAALEYTRAGVRINAVCPGTVDTPMLQDTIAGDPGFEKLMRRTTPTGEFGRPEEVAEVAVWLCSDRARYVNGESVICDAGAIAR